MTRGAMADLGYCPSPRLFEASACGAAILSDTWEGIGQFFEPGDEILAAGTTEEAIAALSISEGAAKRIAAAGRERTLARHTAGARARELEDALASVYSGTHAAARV